MVTKLKIFFLLLLISLITHCTDKYKRRIIIPIGTEEHEVFISSLSESGKSGPYSVEDFFVDSNHNLYFKEFGPNIKVFSNSGIYLRTIPSHECQKLFLCGNVFIGKRINKHGKDELIFFSKEDGRITYDTLLSFDKWWSAAGTIPYKIKNDLLLFSSKGGGRGVKKVFNVKKKYFHFQDIRELDDSTEQLIYLKYGESRADEIGKINNYYLFWFPSPHKDTSYLYSLRALDIETGNFTHIQVNLKYEDVGLEMPGCVGQLIDNKYLYTIGHSRFKEDSECELWITQIDLKIILPDLWSR